MVKILLPYVEMHAKLKKAIWSLGKYSPDIELVLINDKERRGMTTVFNEYFTGEDDLILWHSDMYATEGWLENLMKYYNQFDIIGMKLLYPNGLIQHYGGAVRSNGVCFHPHQGCLDFCLDKPIEVPFVTWGGVLVKKEVIKKIGKLDEQFFQTYYGDVDYCFRARKAGFKVGVVPVVLIHEESQDNKSSMRNLNEIMIRNHDIFVSKWIEELANVSNKTI